MPHGTSRWNERAEPAGGTSRWNHSPGSSRTIRVLRALVLAVPFIAVVLGQSEVIRDVSRRAARVRGSVDVALAQDRRLEPLRSILPEYGVVGYHDPDQENGGIGAVQSFYLSQYALAPRVLLISAEPEFVIYSSHRGRTVDPGMLPAGLQVYSQVRPDLAVFIRLR